jgi:hypothetical protein
MSRVALVVLLGLFAIMAQSQILAVDYGTMFVKAALVHTGAGKSFSIVENPKSNRKFINSVTNHLFRWASIERNASMRQTL